MHLAQRMLWRMFIQHQIKRTLSMAANTSYIKHLMENEDLLHRTDLATRVCKQYEIYDARGQSQIGGCVKALRQLYPPHPDFRHWSTPFASHGGVIAPRNRTGYYSLRCLALERE